MSKVDEHLRWAQQSGMSYHRFDHLWKALNVLYRSERSSGGELEHLHQAIEKLDGDHVGIVRSAELELLAGIKSVYDEKTWLTKGVKDSKQHNIVKKIVKEIRKREPTLRDLQDVAELLYVIRCNHAHGEKTPQDPRDEEVLDAAAPILNVIVTHLRKRSAGTPADAAS